MNSFKFIKSTFLELTSKTYPYGCEDDLFEEMRKKNIFPNFEKDAWGNYFYKIGESRSIFASHLDTACKDQVKVSHVITNQKVVWSNGTTILGADDKAGVTILLWMIKNNIPGLYYFFIGEEVGCIGSGLASKYGDFKGKYDRMISFDRRGTNSVITYQSSSRCCSDVFASALSKELNKQSNFFYKKDDTGVYTDSAEFVDIIPECTNLSVGYYQEHTNKEHQDLYHLSKLALSCLNIDWENLPTKRDMLKKDSKWFGSGYIFNDIHDKSKISSMRNKYFDDRFLDDYDDYSYGNYISSPKDKFESKKTSQTLNDIIDNKTTGKKYYDSTDGLLPISNNKNNPGMCDVMIEKFLTSNLTKDELECVRNQYLNMDDMFDRNTYDNLSVLL